MRCTNNGSGMAQRFRVALPRRSATTATVLAFDSATQTRSRENSAPNLIPVVMWHVWGFRGFIWVAASHSKVGNYPKTFTSEVLFGISKRREPSGQRLLHHALLVFWVLLAEKPAHPCANHDAFLGRVSRQTLNCNSIELLLPIIFQRPHPPKS